MDTIYLLLLHFILSIFAYFIFFKELATDDSNEAKGIAIGFSLAIPEVVLILAIVSLVLYLPGKILDLLDYVKDKIGKI
jgi:hypothetical protein